MKTKLTWFDKMMLGVTFAEANMAAAAREYAEGNKCQQTKRQCKRPCEEPATNEQEVDAGSARI